MDRPDKNRCISHFRGFGTELDHSPCNEVRDLLHVPTQVNCPLKQTFPTEFKQDSESYNIIFKQLRLQSEFKCHQERAPSQYLARGNSNKEMPTPGDTDIGIIITFETAIITTPRRNMSTF